jgi:hypothetical protein
MMKINEQRAGQMIKSTRAKVIFTRLMDKRNEDYVTCRPGWHGCQGIAGMMK